MFPQVSSSRHSRMRNCKATQLSAAYASPRPGPISEFSSPYFHQRHVSPQPRRLTSLVDCEFSLKSFHRRPSSIEDSLRVFRQQKEAAVEVNQSRVRKRKLARILTRTYGIRFTRADIGRLSEEELTTKAVKGRSLLAATNAARQMVQWYRRQVLGRRVEAVRVRNHLAAYRIQLEWKRYYVSARQRQAVKERERTRAAETIQRVYRGYRAREICRKRKLMRDINSLHFHYERVRYRSMLSKAPVILKSWRLHRLRQVSHTPPPVLTPSPPSTRPPLLRPSPIQLHIQPVSRRSSIPSDDPQSVFKPPSRKTSDLSSEETLPESRSLMRRKTTTFNAHRKRRKSKRFKTKKLERIEEVG